VEHRPGCFPPANCALMRGIGLWNTGRAVPPPPGDGIVEHGGRGKLCRRRAARPLSGDMIVERRASCDSRPDILGSPGPGRWSCRTQARLCPLPRQAVPGDRIAELEHRV
jgi:hypothetical protein